MKNHLHTLEQAISDVGFWRWWTAELPRLFQIEFGGTQLHFAPSAQGQPPNNIVALRFLNPSTVAVLTDVDAVDLDPDWRQALHDDLIDPFRVNHDVFTLTSVDVLRSAVAGCQVEYLWGETLERESEDGGVMLAFRAGPVGMVVLADSMLVIAVPGELGAQQIEDAGSAWWEYWREYWARRFSSEPMPLDYACEVTFPINP